MTYAIYSIHVLKKHLSWPVGQRLYSKGKHHCLNYSIILLFYLFGFSIDVLWNPDVIPFSLGYSIKW